MCKLKTLEQIQRIPNVPQSGWSRSTDSGVDGHKNLPVNFNPNEN